VISIAVGIGLVLGFLAPEEDWTQAAAIGTGPLTVLVLGSRMRWYVVALFAAMHLGTLVFVSLSQDALRFGLSYAIHRVDYGTIGLIGGACVLGSEVIWILLRMIRGTPIVVEPICPACSYNLTGNVTGICPECGTKFTESDAGFRLTVSVSTEGKMPDKLGMWSDTR
jgi:hypothetical protein